VIMLHNIYLSRTSHVYYIHVTTWIHEHTVHDLFFCYCSRYCQTYWYFIFTFYLYYHYIFIFLLLLFVLFLCTLAGPVLIDLYYFSVNRSESQYRVLIIEHIMIQPLLRWVSSITWLVLFRYGGWYCLWFSILYMCFHLCA